MVLVKNQEYEITIEDIGNDGEGVGHIDGMAVFVKDTVPGDVARIKIIKDKKKYAYGRLMEIITPSKDRVTPICPHARACGGCSIMQLSYEKQLEWKQAKVANCLKRIGGIDNVEELMEPIIGMDIGYNDNISNCVEDFPAIRYRNKAQFPVGRDKDGNIDLYSGEDGLVVPLMSIGAIGVISVIANIAPKKTHDMVIDYLEGRHDVALKAQLEALPLVDALFSEVNPIPVKTALNIMGKEVGPLRSPLCEMSDDNVKVLEQEMKKYGVI